MPITSSVSADGKTITISVTGRFDFGVQNEFRECYCKGHPGDGVSYVIDMDGANYMDSSALGMLLMMREHLGEGSANISIRNCAPDIYNILTIANFQNLFGIE